MPSSLDTNCLLRWILQDIPYQEVAVHKLLSKPGNYHVADLTISEVVYVLEKLYKYPRLLIAENLNLLVSLNQINCNRTLISQVVPLYLTHTTLSFNDCCLAIYAELNEATPLYTFDKDLARKVPQAELLVSS